jgi:ankyrin repeat protein
MSNLLSDIVDPNNTSTSDTMSASLNELFLAACESLNIEKISACLTIEVDINTGEGRYGTTGLMACVARAASQECDRATELLLQQPGLDINKQNYTTQASALYLASFHSNHTAVAKLSAMPGVKLNIMTIDGITPLYMAVGRGHIESVRALNVNGVDWNLKSGGDSAVMLAVKSGRTEIFKYLIEISDVDLNTRDAKNKTLKTVAR